MALSCGVRVQTAEPSDSLWAAVMAVRAEGLLLHEIDRDRSTRWNGRLSQAGTVQREPPASGHVGRANTRTNTKGRTNAQNKTRTNVKRINLGRCMPLSQGSVAGRGRALPGGPRPSLMTTEFAGLGGGEEVGASRGRVWPEVGGPARPGGPGSSPEPAGPRPGRVAPRQTDNYFELFYFKLDLAPAGGALGALRNLNRKAV